MRLDRVIHWFLPREERFHELFLEDTGNLKRAATVFLEIARSRDASDREIKLVDLKAIEHTGDQITRRIFEALNSTFLTPLDREDIRGLAVDVDDVLDYLEGIAQFLVIFESGASPEPLVKFAEILVQLIDEIHLIIDLVWEQRNAPEVSAAMVRISELENLADGLFMAALGSLFRSDSGRDPLEVLKWKEIYQGLEDACDKCKDFTHVVGNIMIKNA